MERKISLILILLLVSLGAVYGADKKVVPVKRTVRQTVKKKAPAVAKPAAVPSSITPEAAASADEGLADLRDDMNKGLASLKSQIDSVKSDNGDARVNGTIFARWQKYTQNSTVANNFDIDRAYINITKKLAGDSSMRVTLDVKRVSDDTKNQNLFGYLKYAYFETPLPVNALQSVPFNTNLRFGLQQNAWIDWDEGIMGMRYIMKSFVDDEGLMSSADFGVGANGKITPAGLPEIEYNTTLVNGSGYATNEGDAKKAFAARFNSTLYEDPVWGKFILGVFGNIASLNGADLSYNGSDKQAGATAAVKGDWGMTYFEYVTGSKSAKKIGGWSGQLVLNAGLVGVPALNAFYRQDFYQPNTATAGTDIKKSFYGLTYDWNKDIKVAADVQNSQTGAGATISALYLHTMVSF